MERKSFLSPLILDLHHGQVDITSSKLHLLLPDDLWEPEEDDLVKERFDGESAALANDLSLKNLSLLLSAATGEMVMAFNGEPPDQCDRTFAPTP
eukprot:765703-Hanusia_phi.AAC.3